MSSSAVIRTSGLGKSYRIYDRPADRLVDFDENLMYPVSGSFVRYLITRHGLTPLKSYFAAASFNHSAAQTRTAFRR